MINPPHSIWTVTACTILWYDSQAVVDLTYFWQIDKTGKYRYIMTRIHDVCKQYIDRRSLNDLNIDPEVTHVVANIVSDIIFPQPRNYQAIKGEHRFAC